MPHATNPQETDDYLGGHAVTNDIESLNPRFQPIARAVIEIMAERVIPIRFPLHKIKITETLRTPARQAEVHAAGASQLKTGWHNYGLAIDVAIFDDHGVYITDGNHPAYGALACVGEALGCVSGFRWKMKDSGHLEWHENFTLEQYRKWLESKNGDPLLA